MVPNLAQASLGAAEKKDIAMKTHRFALAFLLPFALIQAADDHGKPKGEDHGKPGEKAKPKDAAHAASKDDPKPAAPAVKEAPKPSPVVARSPVHSAEPRATRPVAHRVEKPDEPMTADEALTRLIRGNRRFAAARPDRPHQSESRRKLLSQGQHPIAAILSCADSRVPPELAFDQGLGDLFTVRVAGNIADDGALGSLEYAAEHLDVPLIVVMGHTKCGAVKATLEGGKKTNTHIDALVNAIEPAVSRHVHHLEEIDTAVRENVQYVMKQIEESKPMLSEMVQSGKLKIVGAVYDISTGKVSLVEKPVPPCDSRPAGAPPTATTAKVH